MGKARSEHLDSEYSSQRFMPAGETLTLFMNTQYGMSGGKLCGGLS